MNHKFHEIIAFLHVVETGSVSAAALLMSLSKSVISQRIANLENKMKVTLLHRSTRGITVTDKGRIFYQRTCRIIQELDRVSEELTGSNNMLCGSVRITAPMTFGTKYLSSVLYDFMDRHPRLSLTLELNDQIADLSGEGYDLGIRIGRLHDSSLIARKLATSRRIVCCSPSYAQKYGLPDSIAELTEHACIGYLNTTSSQIWRFEPEKAHSAPLSVIVRSRINVNNGESIQEAAIAGLGIAVLPEFIIAEALSAGRLIKVLPGKKPLTDVIYAIYPRSRYTSYKVRAIIEYMASVFNGKPDWKKIMDSKKLS